MLNTLPPKALAGPANTPLLRVRLRTVELLLLLLSLPLWSPGML
jgi:hypothetical protein